MTKLLEITLDPFVSVPGLYFDSGIVFDFPELIGSSIDNLKLTSCNFLIVKRNATDIYRFFS